MPASRTTTNYGLPQYIADDKPKYLTDFNNAMDKIDTVIKGVADTVSSATENSNTAIEKATSAESTANSAKSTAESANTQATTNKNILLSFFEGFNNIESWTPLM